MPDKMICCKQKVSPGEEVHRDLILKIIAPGQEFGFLLSSGKVLNYGLAGSHDCVFDILRSRRESRPIPVACYMRRPVPLHPTVKVIHYDEETQ